MSCVNHPLVDASGRCDLCGREICDACGVIVGDRRVCRSCLEGAVEEQARRPHSALKGNRLVAGCLSVIPGLGHMYLGLIGKGFAIMGLLILTIFLVVVYSDSTGMYWMTAYLVPTISLLLMSYAVFDSIAVADSLRAAGRPESDPTMDLITERVLLNRKTAAYVILVAGIVGLLHLFESVLATVMRYLGLDVPATALVVPVLLLIVGIRMLLRGRRAPSG